ncbi:MAG: hypothetical protein HRT57_04100 [Crocinitomicaceae bacterium]|nr:hypothetical protein [Crocinitomicaceae bacterium]
MNEEKDIFDFIEKRKVDMPNKAYFDNMAQSVIDSQKTKIIPLYKRPITWISTAAAAILVFLIVNFNSPDDLPIVPPQVASDELSKEELLAYVDENIDEFDVEMIAEFVPMDELNAKYEEFQNEMFEDEDADPLESITLENITKEDILEYLNDEDLDFSDLEEDSFI